VYSYVDYPLHFGDLLPVFFFGDNFKFKCLSHIFCLRESSQRRQSKFIGREGVGECAVKIYLKANKHMSSFSSNPIFVMRVDRLPRSSPGSGIDATERLEGSVWVKVCNDDLYFIYRVELGQSPGLLSTSMRDSVISSRCTTDPHAACLPGWPLGSSLFICLLSIVDPSDINTLCSLTACYCVRLGRNYPAVLGRIADRACPFVRLFYRCS